MSFYLLFGIYNEGTGACLIDHTLQRKQSYGAWICLLFTMKPVSYKYEPISFHAFKEENCLSIKMAMHKLTFTPN